MNTFEHVFCSYLLLVRSVNEGKDSEVSGAQATIRTTGRCWLPVVYRKQSLAWRHRIRERQVYESVRKRNVNIDNDDLLMYIDEESKTKSTKTDPRNIHT